MLETLKKSSSSSNPMYRAHIKIWTGSGEEKTAATHTHRKERGQMSPPAQERYGDVCIRKKLIKEAHVQKRHKKTNKN